MWHGMLCWDQRCHHSSIFDTKVAHLKRRALKHFLVWGEESFLASFSSWTSWSIISHCFSGSVSKDQRSFLTRFWMLRIFIFFCNIRFGDLSGCEYVQCWFTSKLVCDLHWILRDLRAWTLLLSVKVLSNTKRDTCPKWLFMVGNKEREKDDIEEERSRGKVKARWEARRGVKMMLKRRGVEGRWRQGEGRCGFYTGEPQSIASRSWKANKQQVRLHMERVKGKKL